MSDNALNQIMGLTGVPRPRFGFNRPIVNVVPLTFRNASSMLEEVEKIKTYLLELTPNLDDNTEKILDAFEETITNLERILIENTVEVQDTVVAELVLKQGSLTWLAMQDFTNNVIVEKPDDPGVFAIRPPVVPELIGVKPDPTDPGFFS